MAWVPTALISLRRAMKEGSAANERTKSSHPEDRLSPRNRCWKRTRDLLLLYILASLSQFGVTEVSPSSSSYLWGADGFGKTGFSTIAVKNDHVSRDKSFFLCFSLSQVALVFCISPSFVLERFQSSEEKVSLHLAFDLRDRPAASLETDVSIAVSRDCRYRKLGEVLLIQLEKKMPFCVHALSAFGIDDVLPSGESWLAYIGDGNIVQRIAAKSFAKTDVPYLCNRWKCQ